MDRGERTVIKSGKDPRTSRNIDEHLSDVLRVRQQFEGFQPFLNDNPEGPSFIHVVLTVELVVDKQARNRLESRICSENDVFRIMHLGKVFSGPSVFTCCFA